MTAYTALHFALAGVCLLVGMFFLVLYRVAGSDQGVLWIGLGFLLFAVIDLCVGGSSTAAGGVGDPRGWLALAVIATPLSCPLIVHTSWSVMDLEPRGWRRVAPWLLLAGGGVFGADLALRIASGTGPESLEGALIRTSRPTAVLYWVCAFLCTAISAFDGMRSFRRSRATAAAVLAVAIVALLLLGHEIALGTGLIGGSTWSALAGIPFLVLGAAVTGLRVARRLRGGDIGRYKIVHPIGGGGMGEMYFAARTGPAGFQRHVALKRMRLEAVAHPKGVDRFLGEARLAAQLHHPNIVGVHDLGEMDGGWFIVMDYVAGVSAAQLLGRAVRAGRQLPAPLVATVGIEVCRGLSYAHAAGVVHRDISADNIMIAFTGEVKIIDFGIAKITESLAALPAVTERPADVTQQQGFVGKVAYAAPERLLGEPASPRSDLFSLGVVLYELLAGRRPFDDSATGSTWSAILQAPYPPLGRLRPDLPDRLEAIIDRSLARRPEGRTQSADEVAAALRDLPSAATLAEVGAFAQALFAEEWAAECSTPGSGTARTLTAAPTDLAATATTRLDASAVP